MSKFHFRLTTLLRLREDARDERRVQLAAAQRADAELQGQLAQVGAELKQLRRQCRAAVNPGEVDLPVLVEVQQYAAELRAKEAGLQQEREALTLEIDRRRETLLEADRDVQTLEKLRDHQLQAHRHEENRQETKRLDEAALQATVKGTTAYAQ
jgi:flagellar protein FliJ